MSKLAAPSQTVHDIILHHFRGLMVCMVPLLKHARLDSSTTSYELPLCRDYHDLMSHAGFSDPEVLYRVRQCREREAVNEFATTRAIQLKMALNPILNDDRMQSVAYL